MTTLTASLQHPPAGTGHPGAAPLLFRSLQGPMQWHQLLPDHVAEYSRSDQFSLKNSLTIRNRAVYPSPR
jgi:hypothetical protein